MTDPATSNIVTDALTQVADAAIDKFGPEALAALAAKCPATLAPTIANYGPSILALGKAGVAAWIASVNAGDTLAAWSALVPSLGNQDLIDALDRHHAALQNLNTINKARIAAEQAAITALVKVLVPIAEAAMTL